MPTESKSFYQGTCKTLIATEANSIIGELSKRVSQQFAGDERKQIQSWEVQLRILKSAISVQRSLVDNWGILIELQLLRLGRRIDTVLLVGDCIVCIEFKIGSSSFNTTDIAQAVDYALCLRDFHQGSRDYDIYPILCSDLAPDQMCIPNFEVVDRVAGCSKANARTLPDLIDKISKRSTGVQIDCTLYEASNYNPTPDIVAAARSIYAGHTVAEIGRSDASGTTMQTAADELAKIATKARASKKHVICFVTGEPGSGKTLLGLDLVFAGEAGRVAGEPAAVLSGNRPLVAVLKEAISNDAKSRFNITMQEARRQAEQALQNLLGYLKEHSEDNSLPPEHVVVFDEAQRAWDAETGRKLLDRETSEPELFIEILGRLDWCCLVCLVGSGQEINRGEVGLSLWGQALANSSTKPNWEVYASPKSAFGAKSLFGPNSNAKDPSLNVITNPGLHLQSNLRAYRNDKHGLWVEALIDGDIGRASRISSEMTSPPALITRDLGTAKRWLRQRRRGDRRVGLLASSQAVRLIADGVPPSPRSNDLNEVAHWFLKPAGDFRSSNALERPLSEFVCQGLELDYACLCWGNDLIWEGTNWLPRKMSAPKWRKCRQSEDIMYRLNAYRVLLTRSRSGMIIFVPYGDEKDLTRFPADFDKISNALLEAGCLPLNTSGQSASWR